MSMCHVKTSEVLREKLTAMCRVPVSFFVLFFNISEFLSPFVLIKVNSI